MKYSERILSRRNAAQKDYRNAVGDVRELDPNEAFLTFKITLVIFLLCSLDLGD